MATQSNANNRLGTIVTVLLTVCVVGYIVKNAPQEAFSDLISAFTSAMVPTPTENAASPKLPVKITPPRQLPANNIPPERYQQAAPQQTNWQQDDYNQDYATQEAARRDYEAQQQEWEAQQQEWDAQVQEAARQSLERDLVELSRKAILRRIPGLSIHGAPGHAMEYTLTGYQWRSNDPANPSIFWVEAYGTYRANVPINFALEIHLNGTNLEVVYCDLMR